MAELTDLGALEMLAGWDQLGMMPGEGAGARAHQLAALAGITHARATAEEIGDWLLELDGSDLSEQDRDVVRLARRDWERARRVPAELAADLSRAHAEGQECWAHARANDDFASFASALQRNVELAQAYADCLATGKGERYQELLQDWDFGLQTDELRRIFAALAQELPPLVAVLSSELAAGGFSVSARELHATLVGVEPSLIRVSADPLTYPLHIILRFELELALIEGDLAVPDLPAAWQDGMRRLLGLEVPSDASGVLQDILWGAGSFGYFPSYALGCLIAAALWEAMEAETGPLEEDLRRGEVSPIQRWLAERVHRHGRRLDTIPLVEHATGRGLEIGPFMRYVAPLAGRA